MNKLILIPVLIFLSSLILSAQEKKGPVLTFEPPAIDFGAIYADDLPDTKLAILFKNTGNAPLVLTHVRACCGTRVTHWPSGPVLPGLQDTIKVEFNLAPRPHRIRRVVIASSNCIQNSSSTFRISGEVIQREE